MSRVFAYVVEGYHFVPLIPYIHRTYIDEASTDTFPLLRTRKKYGTTYYELQLIILQKFCCG